MIAVSGAAHVVLEPGEPAPSPLSFLTARKSRKYMGLQDVLAVVCAGRALEQAQLTASGLGQSAGLYLAVGYIPFEERDLGPVLESSLEAGEFSLTRFAAGGYQRAHPLLTFRCLPNMPAYHVSANFDVQGPYFVTYPGPGQLYQALDEAVCALRRGQIEVALLGGVAHQNNFLVQHHFQRLEPSVPPERLRDAGALLVLELEERIERRGAMPLARLLGYELDYEPFDPCARWPEAEQHLKLGDHDPLPEILRADHELGAASLPVALAAIMSAPHTVSLQAEHAVRARDGVRASSHWEILGSLGALS